MPVVTLWERVDKKSQNQKCAIWEMGECVKNAIAWLQEHHCSCSKLAKRERKRQAIIIIWRNISMWPCHLSISVWRYGVSIVVAIVVFSCFTLSPPFHSLWIFSPKCSTFCTYEMRHWLNWTNLITNSTWFWIRWAHTCSSEMSVSVYFAGDGAAVAAFARVWMVSFIDLQCVCNDKIKQPNPAVSNNY